MTTKEAAPNSTYTAELRSELGEVLWRGEAEVCPDCPACGGRIEWEAGLSREGRSCVACGVRYTLTAPGAQAAAVDFGAHGVPSEAWIRQQKGLLEHTAQGTARDAIVAAVRLAEVRLAEARRQLALIERAGFKRNQHAGTTPDGIHVEPLRGFVRRENGRWELYTWRDALREAQ